MAAGKSQDQDSHHYGVVGVAAIALGAALLLVPNKTLALAALLLGVYFVTFRRGAHRQRCSWSRVCRAAGVCWTCSSAFC